MNRPRFEVHRRHFETAKARAALARMERLVLDRRWTSPRSLRLDRALVNYERKGTAA